MKIIFLDIDGVLATEDDSKKPNHELYAYPFDRGCVKVFNEILLKTEAKIVLSSDWRLMYNNDLDVLAELFKHNGVIKSPIDVTPNLGRKREEEIVAFIQSNKERIDNFVILDDEDLNCYPNNFVKCQIATGIRQDGIKEKIISKML